MKKSIFLLTIGSLAFGDCLIDYSKYKKLPKNEIIKLAKKCNNTKSLKNYYIVGEKEIVIKIKPKQNKVNAKLKQTQTKKISQNIKDYLLIKMIKDVPKETQKTKKTDIYKILAKKPLSEILKYAISKKLTNKKIATLIIQKSKNYPDLDYEYIKEKFNKEYTISNLQTLLKAIKEN